MLFILGLFFFIEIFIGYFLFIKKSVYSNNNLATIQFIQKAQYKLNVYLANREIKKINLKLPKLNHYEYIFLKDLNETRDFKEYLITLYSSELMHLKKIAENTKIKMIYIPADKNVEYNNYFSNIFKKISNKLDIDFLNAYDVFGKFSPEEIYLRPYNGHLSRFANIRLAELINNSIPLDTISNQNRTQCKNIEGFFSRNSKETSFTIPHVPYVIETDSFGFRKTKKNFNINLSNILILGDSFTFGPFLSNQDTYPSILQRTIKNFNILNGGVSGFTIVDEKLLLEKNYKCLNPSLIILQVTDNDLLGLISVSYNNSHLSKNRIRQSVLEKKYIEYLNNNF